MTDKLLIVSSGVQGRLAEILKQVLAGIPHDWCSLPALPPMRGRRVVLAASLDEGGITPELLALLRYLRQNDNCMENARVALMVDGMGEMDTKQAGRMLMLEANRAGGWLMGKPLLEATGSLRNLSIRAKRMGLSLPDAYHQLARELLERLLVFTPPVLKNPKLVMLHASNQTTSNTFVLGQAVCKKLDGVVQTRELSLRNGTLHDCKGCSYKVCSHFAEQGTCFYGGAMVEDMYPAILESDILLMLCPNYNDAIGANLMALINRLTSLTVNNLLEGKLVYGIVVSGYSGGDLVAEQLLGALCLNKAFTLPPRCCWLETANDPLEAICLPDIERRIDGFARQILAVCE